MTFLTAGDIIKNRKNIRFYLIQFPQFHAPLSAAEQEFFMKKMLKVTGMACAHCASKVCTKAASLAGVTNADVNLDAGVLTVEFDENVITAKEIADAVTSIGFPTSAESI